VTLLIVAGLLWLGLHTAYPHAPARRRGWNNRGKALPGRLFAVVAGVPGLAGLRLRAADTTPLWYAPAWFVAVVDVVMLAALLLLVAGVIPPRGAGDGPRGIFRITRHR